MGELAEDFAIMNEARKRKRDHLEPHRVAFALEQLCNVGYEAEYDSYEKCILFKHNGYLCRLYPFTGWWSGKGIGSARGIKNLIRKLERTRNEENKRRHK